MDDTRQPPAPATASPRAPRGATPPKPTVEVLAATAVDLAVIAVFGAALLGGRIADPWLQGVCLVGLLLLAGVRVADLRAAAQGLPTRGGPAALMLAAGAALAARIGGGGVS